MGLIRLLLAMAVLVEHSGTTLLGLRLTGGELAVKAFYAISGFYMAMILQERYAGRPLAFWRNRALRLFPLYWALLLPLLVLSAGRLLSSHGTHGAFLDPWRLFSGSVDLPGLLLAGATTLSLFGQDLLFFVAADPQTGALHFSNALAEPGILLHRFLPIPVSWTLSLELSFYLLAPWICRLRVRWIAALALGSLALRVGLSHAGLSLDPWSYRFFPTSLVFFLAGVLAWKSGVRMPDRMPTAARAALWSGLLVLILLWPGHGERDELLAVGVLAACLPAVFALARDWAWDRRIGDLSYPLYLCHWPVIAVTPGLPVVAQAALGLLLAAALHLTVGRAVERLRHPA